MLLQTDVGNSATEEIGKIDRVITVHIVTGNDDPVMALAEAGSMDDLGGWL